MECLALEVCSPVSRDRAQWASNIMQQLSGETWCMIGMLADLAEDCMGLVRRMDDATLDPVTAAQAIDDFKVMVTREYVSGNMWMRREATYTARIMDMLQETMVVQFGCLGCEERLHHWPPAQQVQMARGCLGGLFCELIRLRRHFGTNVRMSTIQDVSEGERCSSSDTPVGACEQMPTIDVLL
jgi:hypothetical protein